MPQLSIKIKIGDREYPMKVDADDEARVRLAGKKVNEKMKQFSQHFGIHEKQDLLAMVAFEACVEQLKLQENQTSSEEGTSQSLIVLDGILSNALGEE